MVKTDVTHGRFGIHNFYKMQLLHNPHQNLYVTPRQHAQPVPVTSLMPVVSYVVWTRWGRVGEMGSFQRTPFPTEIEAITDFNKQFKAKTGNEWSNRVGDSLALRRRCSSVGPAGRG